LSTNHSPPPTTSATTAAPPTIRGTSFFLEAAAMDLRIPKSTRWTGAIYRTFVPGKG
jgi:hypothetical protein